VVFCALHDQLACQPR